MLNGFMGYLTRRKKQAFTGMPADAMQWDETKKRYVFAGEDSSSDEEPPAPPPVARKQDPAESERKKNEEEKAKQPVTGAAALTAVAFGGALAGRGRGRGRGRGGRGGAAPANRFASTFSPSQIKATPEPIAETKPTENSHKA